MSEYELGEIIDQRADGSFYVMGPNGPIVVDDRYELGEIIDQRADGSFYVMGPNGAVVVDDREELNELLSECESINKQGERTMPEKLRRPEELLGELVASTRINDLHRGIDMFHSALAKLDLQGLRNVKEFGIRKLINEWSKVTHSIVLFPEIEGDIANDKTTSA